MKIILFSYSYIIGCLRLLRNILPKYITLNDKYLNTITLTLSDQYIATSLGTTARKK